VGISRDVYTIYDPKLEQSGSQAPKLKVSIELQLESISLKIKTVVTVDAGTDWAHRKAI
jgi:hypothetical protein